MVTLQSFLDLSVAYKPIRIKKGVSAQHPEKYVLDEDELKRVSALSRIELEEMKKEVEKAQKLAASTNNDDEDDEDDVKDADDEE